MNRVDKIDAYEAAHAAGPLPAYEALLEAGELKPDADQRATAERLQRLHDELADYACEGPRDRGFFKRLFKGKPDVPKSVYLWGGVGRGKSMLMDLVFAGAPLKAKKRVHFHEFMIDVHARLNRWRKMSAGERKRAGADPKSDDPIAPAAAAIAAEACLLCFDEFHVTNVADAMILGRLITALLAHGTVIVATSNRPPKDLYKGGLNRQLFEPAIALLERDFDVLSLEGPMDYRLERMRGMDTYLTPVNAVTTQQLRRDFYRLTDRDVEDPGETPSGEIDVDGRQIFVPKDCKGVAVFSFKRLCAQPLGAKDYLAIARRYHTVIIVAIPQMGRDRRNEAKRFTTLIDVLYENNVKLLCSAEAPPDALYAAGDESFEFQRTVSRLMEMQSDAYLQRGHGRG